MFVTPSLWRFYPSIIFAVCSSQPFDQRYTGVVLDPYVKMTEQSEPYAQSYTREDARIMLEVISERFSKVIARETGAISGSYIKDVTYYNGSNFEVNIAEIAATINLQRGRKALTIIQGMRQHDNEEQLDTEVRLGIECAEKANKIYPGTVEGLLFYRTILATGYAIAERTFKYLSILKYSSDENLKLGTRISCHVLFDDTKGDETAESHLKVIKKILQLSDFVLCDISSTDEYNNDGPVAAFETISRRLLKYRRRLPEIKGGLEIMADVEWANEGFNKWHNLENFHTFWKHANQWATNHSFPIWFIEAFDNPWHGNKTYMGHRGWWRLTNNSRSHQRDGYVEKVYEQLHGTPTSTTASPIYVNTTTLTTSQTNAAVIVSIALGCLLIVVVVALILSLVFRSTQQLQQLSEEDIRQFIEGIAAEFSGQQADLKMDPSALQYPYDNSFEIQKEHLIIQHDKILGMGQFGFVFKAMVEYPPGECRHAAVKVARDDCTRNGLKGLLSEIKIMTYIGSHPNIVGLMGAYTAELHKGIVYIATELCSLGSLQSHLRGALKLETSNLEHGNTSKPISFEEMIKWSLEIASGMEYLGRKNVVHADLATRNVLLTAERTAKISDFGLSRRMYDYTNYIKTEQEPLPWRWMAIESLKRCEFSGKSDVWSYGVTLWEIFSLGDTPYPGLAWTTGFANMLVGGLRMERPTHATPQLYNLLVDCWNMDPERRPNFLDIQETIGGMSAYVIID